MDFEFTKANSEHEKIEMFVSCRNLINRDLVSKSDPYIIFSMKDRKTGQYVLKDKTETIKDNLNPNFLKTFIVDFIFEIRQDCRFEVWDYDSQTKSDFLGYAEATIGEIAGSKGQTLILSLKDSNDKKIKSKLIIRTEKVSHSKEKYFFKFKAEKLSNQSFWLNLVSGKSPFFILYKSREDGTWLKTYESTVVMDNKNPIWKGFEIESSKLNDADHLRPFKIECWNWKKSGTHKFFGECSVTIEKLLNKERKFELINKKKSKSKIGYLICEDFSFSLMPDFFDYLRGGLQLNFILGIDFTGSNGIPTDPSSLHAITNNGSLNQYQEAIQKVGEIILNYDYDKVIPAFGFGAKPHFPTLFEGKVSHCFPLSGDWNQTEVYGLKGVFELYAHAMNYIEFSGPTLIHPIIEKAKNFARDCKTYDKGIYNILMILTDGEIYEMDTTITSIIEAGDLPLSIILVGIGNSNFEKMMILDGDDGLMNREGKKAHRDIVQFVPFRNYKGIGEELAQKVLEEVPYQVIQYQLSIGKKPGPPINIDVDKLMKKMDTERQSILNIRSYSQDMKKRPLIPAGLYVSEDLEENENKQENDFILPKAENFNSENFND